MTHEELKEAEKLCTEATPGPWNFVFSCRDCDSLHLVSEDCHSKEHGASLDNHEANHIFIARMRTLAPLMLAEIRELHMKNRILVNEVNILTREIRQ